MTANSATSKPLVDNENDAPNARLQLAQQPEATSPEAASTEAKRGADVTRRLVCKALGFVGLGYLADKITGGQLSKAILGQPDTENASEHDPEAPEAVSDKLNAKAHEIAAKVEAESAGLSPREKALKVVDWCGLALFGWGIKDLLPGGHGHIHKYHYGALLALSSAKYALSDEEGRHHLVEETKSNATALGIIGGTIVMAEGLNMDVQTAYESITAKKPTKKDQVAVMTMLATCLSPAVTTVGSSGIIKKMSNELCEGDKKMMSVCVSHVSNLSGYLLFGDPPFIAICEKYGFAEGMKWQMQTMWPLAIYSLFRATYKLNKILAEKEGLTGAAAGKKALSDSLSGIKANVPVLAKMIAKSLGNVGKYYSGADFSKKFAQDKGGIEVKIGEVLAEKVTNLGKLPFVDEFDKSAHGEHAAGHAVALHSVKEDEADPAGHLIEDFLDRFGVRGPEMATVGAEVSGGGPEVPDDHVVHRVNFRRAIERRDYEEVSVLGGKLGVGNVEVFVNMLKGFHAAEAQGPAPQDTRVKDVLRRLKPTEIYERSTNIHRIKSALGHNLGDVVNVFPFQAGCVPFLTTVFKDIMSGVEKTGQFSKELFGFLLIMGFSMIADNYVACKIGLEIFPDKPQIPLIASIQGGSMTAIGNMANIAQFGLEDYPLMDSVKQMGMNFEPAAVSFAWAKVLDLFKDWGFSFATPPKAQKGAGSAKEGGQKTHGGEVAQASASVAPASAKVSTRGNFLGLDKLRKALSDNDKTV